MTIRTSAAHSRQGPHGLIVCRYLGEASETWMYRQIVGFRQIVPTVVCWGRKSDALYPTNGIPTEVVPFDPSPENSGRRWIRRVLNIRSGNFYGAVGPEFRALKTIAQVSRATVALCHFGQVALRMLPVARQCGIPVVAHFHGMDVSSSLRNRWYRWSLLRHLRSFAKVVVVGKHQRDWMLAQGIPEAQVHLIPCGVPTNSFEPPPSKPPGRRLTITAVSRLVRWKGVEESLRAFALACASGLDAELNVVGDGPELDRLRLLAAELDIEARVCFHRSQPPVRIKEILGQSDIFIQHSLTGRDGWCEGFGVSLAEAAAMELPVVATRSGGIPDQVMDGETGILIEERDIPAMARAIDLLAAHPDLRTRMGRAGRERMINHFDTAGQVSKLEAVMLAAAAQALN